MIRHVPCFDNLNLRTNIGCRTFAKMYEIYKENYKVKTNGSLKPKKRHHFFIILSLQTNMENFANKVDLDKMVLNKPSHQDLHCLLFYY